MATKTYLPSREADLVNWSTNFYNLINLSAAAYGLTLDQAANYGLAQSAFVSAYQVANNASTRTSVTIAAKNTKKGELIEATRTLVDVVQAWPEMTNAKREALQITVRDDDPTPVPPPSEAPILDIVAVTGRVVKIRLHGEASLRGKPEGVIGAATFSFVGDQPPVDINAWVFRGNTSKTVENVAFDAQVAPGAKVWLTAFWFNRKSQSGPACAPVSTHVGAGLAQAA